MGGSAKSIDGSLKRMGGSLKSTDGSFKSTDGSSKSTNGIVKITDGSTKIIDGSPKRRDGNAKSINKNYLLGVFCVSEQKNSITFYINFYLGLACVLCERDSSGTTRRRMNKMNAARVMERIARRKPTKKAPTK
jgi:hypothetical protein